MPGVRAACRGLVRVLDQAIRLVESLDLESYAAPCPPLSLHGVGAHVRHELDCVLCLLDGLPEGRIDYDRRRRDRRVEVDPACALRLLREVSARLEALASIRGETPLWVRAEVPEEETGGWTRSTVGRELGYALGHTIHHHALIACLLRQRGIEPGAEFGVAPSTLRHWQESAACPALPG